MLADTTFKLPTNQIPHIYAADVEESARCMKEHIDARGDKYVLVFYVFRGFLYFMSYLFISCFFHLVRIIFKIDRFKYLFDKYSTFTHLLDNNGLSD